MADITFALDNITWDLTLNVDGNINTKSDIPQIEQDVSSSTRVWYGELDFNTQRGVNYLEIFDNKLSLNFATSQIENQALYINNVSSALITNITFNDRTLKGNLQITLTTGEVTNVNIQ